MGANVNSLGANAFTLTPVFSSISVNPGATVSFAIVAPDATLKTRVLSDATTDGKHNSAQ